MREHHKFSLIISLLLEANGALKNKENHSKSLEFNTMPRLLQVDICCHTSNSCLAISSSEFHCESVFVCKWHKYCALYWLLHCVGLSIVLATAGACVWIFLKPHFIHFTIVCLHEWKDKNEERGPVFYNIVVR